MVRSDPMIEILYFAGCPNHESTVMLVRDVLADLGLSAEVREVSIEWAEAAEANRFIGSPSVRINGRDVEPEARDRTDFGLGCRMYRRGGVPPKTLLEAGLREAS